MQVDGRQWRTIWPGPDGRTVEIIDQTKLPHSFETRRLETLEDAAEAIAMMRVRGAPLIGATAAYGLCLALRDDPSDRRLDEAAGVLAATRPTAINLRWALDTMTARLKPLAPAERLATAYARAAEICDDDVATCRAIGAHGARLISEIWERQERRAPVNLLTHCNAGWLATIDWGTALAPVYVAHDQGVEVHVWVDETRPRNQGAGLTAWELLNHGVPHTVIADNAGGHLMQRGRVDLCITGTDRTTANGDVCNKIGTYLKALAAHDNDVPFYVALPHSTIDWSLTGGLEQIPIEERDASEVTHVTGCGDDGQVTRVRVTPRDSPALNPAFDVTPARLVSGLITERGVCAASSAGLAGLYPEMLGE
jgi:methylthioribose-1-phosphate isomerase